MRATACYGPLHFTLWPRKGQPEALKKPASAAPPGQTVRKTADGEQASVTVEVKPDKPAAKPAQTVARQPAAQGKPEAPKPADSVPTESADAEGSAKKSGLPFGISARIDAAMQLLSNDPTAFARCMLGHTGWLGRHLLRSVRVSGLDIFWTVTADAFAQPTRLVRIDPVTHRVTGTVSLGRQSIDAILGAGRDLLAITDTGRVIVVRG